MATVRTLYLPHYPAYPIYISMFKDVTNADSLRKQLMEANPDFDYAFLDASMIPSLRPLLLATQISLQNHITTRLKTRTPHSELVFRLHPNNNIGEAYRKFGISDNTTSMIAVKIGGLGQEYSEEAIPGGAGERDVTAETVARHLGDVVKGGSVDVGEEGEGVGAFCDRGLVRRVYKIGGGDQGKGKKGKGEVNGAGEERDEVKEMESVILGIITLKGS